MENQHTTTKEEIQMENSSTRWMRRLGAAVAFAALASPAVAQEYKIGYITDLSGPLAGSYTPTWQGFELYMKAVNDRGGINGRKVLLFLDDDGLRADRAVAAAKKQTERNEVLGIFGLSLSSTHAPVLVEMRKINVPVVTAFSAILDALPPAKPNSYSTGVMFEVAGETIGSLLQRITPKGKVVGMTIDTVGGRAAVRHNKQMVESIGYTWDEVVFPVRTSDFSPFALTVAAMKPDIVVGHYGAEQNLGMIPALRKAGYDGPYVIASYGVSEETVKKATDQAGSGRNIFLVSRYATVSDDTPGMRSLKAAAKQYGVANPNMMHGNGWVLGKFAAEALGKCGANCTRDSLDKTIQTLTVETDALTGGPIQMTAQDHYGPTYWRLYRWENNQLVGVGDWLKKEGLKFPAQ
jgi:branched-chain amino acid transport system substrate-binding protein